MLTTENSLELARLALPKFGFNPDDVTLTFIKMRENTVFRADTPDGPIALRLHRPGYRSLAEVNAESEYIDILAQHGFDVVQLIQTIEGTYTAVVNDGETEAIVDAQRWLEHSQQLGDTENAESTAELDATHFHALGTIAARMHIVAENLAGTHSFFRQPWDAEGLVGKNALWGDATGIRGLTNEQQAQLLRSREVILNALDKFGRNADVYGTIHADFTPENVLVHEGKLIVIDFDDFGDGWYLFDLATVLFWFLEHPEYEAFRSSLLAGYRELRELNAEQEELLQLFLVARGFTYLGWAATRPETDTAEFLATEIKPLVLRIAAELEREFGEK